MSKYQNKYRTETARLKSWDYTNPWWYFVTICTKNHKEYFGEINNEKMVLNELGKIAEQEIRKIELLRDNVEVDYYVVMPNHIHMIIILNEIKCRDNKCRDVARYVSTIDENTKLTNNYFSEISPKPNSLSSIVRSYKSAVTKKIKEMKTEKFYWQSRFYDRIIRNEKELFNIRKYIQLNPLKWELEKDFPENIE